MFTYEQTMQYRKYHRDFEHESKISMNVRLTAATLIPPRILSRIFIFSPGLKTLQLFFASLSLLCLRFDSIMLSKGNIIDSKMRENNTTQVDTVTA
jgi:hypothetical protein